MGDMIYRPILGDMALPGAELNRGIFGFLRLWDMIRRLKVVEELVDLFERDRHDPGNRAHRRLRLDRPRRGLRDHPAG